MKLTQEKNYFMGLSFNEKDEVFRKRQTYMHFGRIKKYLFLLKLSLTDASVFNEFV